MCIDSNRIKKIDPGFIDGLNKLDEVWLDKNVCIDLRYQGIISEKKGTKILLDAVRDLCSNFQAPSQAEVQSGKSVDVLTDSLTLLNQQTALLHKTIEKLHEQNGQQFEENLELKKQLQNKNLELEEKTKRNDYLSRKLEVVQSNCREWRDNLSLKLKLFYEKIIATFSLTCARLFHWE